MSACLEPTPSQQVCLQYGQRQLFIMTAVPQASALLPNHSTTTSTAWRLGQGRVIFEQMKHAYCNHAARKRYGTPEGRVGMVGRTVTNDLSPERFHNLDETASHSSQTSNQLDREWHSHLRAPVPEPHIPNMQITPPRSSARVLECTCSIAPLCHLLVAWCRAVHAASRAQPNQ